MIKDECWALRVERSTNAGSWPLSQRHSHEGYNLTLNFQALIIVTMFILLQEFNVKRAASIRYPLPLISTKDALDRLMFKSIHAKLRISCRHHTSLSFSLSLALSRFLSFPYFPDGLALEESILESNENDWMQTVAKYILRKSKFNTRRISNIESGS